MGLSRSCSTAGQWDGLAASTPSPSFPWDCFPEGKRGCGKEEDLGLHRELVQGAGKGMAGKTLG